MIYGNLDKLDQYGFLLCQPAWSAAFDWLKSVNAQTEIGKYPILGDEMFGVVMQYDTVEAESSRFETHRKYVDLQYTISGGEAITWSASSALEVDGEYDQETDLQFYLGKTGTATVEMCPGNFSIYYPTDAHLPKLKIEGADSVYKAVIKIGRHLIQ